LKIISKLKQQRNKDMASECDPIREKIKELIGEIEALQDQGFPGAGPVMKPPAMAIKKLHQQLSNEEQKLAECEGWPVPPPHGPLFVFSDSIITGGLAALGGSVTVTVNQDGSVRWQGHAHDSGIDGYDFGISAILRTSSGRAIAFAHSGHVGGTVEVWVRTLGDIFSDSHESVRDHDWDEIHPPMPLISVFLSDYKDAKLNTHLEYSSSIGSAFESIVSWLIKFGVTTVIDGVFGASVVFIGVEIGSLIATGSLVPGARVIGGILWMAGPANTLFAIAAEGIASIGSRTRELSKNEYDWANEKVFLGSLPPQDKILLTDTIGSENRAFTFPRYDGKITLNMGPSAFNDPRSYQVNSPKEGYMPEATTKYGEVFVHELVHACQIQHSKMDVVLIADVLANVARGKSAYLYGPAGQDYLSFNLEQQAQIVSDWFAGSVLVGSNQTNVEMDINSPYFRYINENIRTRNL
jgi:hypothetical protein